jgi:hypothetical protein
MEILSLIVSVIAILCSIFTYFIHDRKLKKQETQINEYQLKKNKDEQLEQKKASVKANLIKEDKGQMIIKVFNAGKAIARNISLNMNDENIIVLMNPFPYEFLNPQESTEIIFSTHEGSPDKLLIDIMWDDDSHSQNTHKQMLTL